MVSTNTVGGWAGMKDPAWCWPSLTLPQQEGWDTSLLSGMGASLGSLLGLCQHEWGGTALFSVVFG